jgi:Cof subfamily protein (haloacid dehalogenase superfamily)
MYKLIFSDIDGTIIKSDHTLSAGTVAAVNRVTQVNKIPVILTTARPPHAVESIYAQLGLSTPVSCFNGSLLLNKLITNGNYNEYTILKSTIVNAALASQINEVAVMQDINCSMYRHNEWFATNHDVFIVKEERATAIAATILPTLQPTISHWANTNDGPHKIMLIGQPDKMDTTEIILKEKFSSQLNIFRSNRHYLEINNIAASKKTAVEFFINKNNIAREQVIALGDNYNDIEMLQFAGLGIAMYNAPDAVKAHADFVTLGNNADGIQFALDKFVG